MSEWSNDSYVIFTIVIRYNANKYTGSRNNNAFRIKMQQCMCPTHQQCP